MSKQLQQPANGREPTATDCETAASFTFLNPALEQEANPVKFQRQF